jgi:hypothetical protein
MTNEQTEPQRPHRVVHRIPWSLPYGYSEVEVDGYLEDGAAANIMFDVVQVEDAYRATYGMLSVADEMEMKANTPAPQSAPQTPQNRAPAPQNTFVDRPATYVCKNDMSHPVKRADKPANTRRGLSYPIRCMVCKDPANPRFNLTIAWEDA